MTKEQLIQSLNELAEIEKDDYEVNHIEADNLLLEFINDDNVKKAFDSVYKWYA